MKKHNARRRVRNQPMKGRKARGARTIAPAASVRAPSGVRASLRRVDLAALVILLLPLFVMAALELWWRVGQQPEGGVRPAQEAAVRVPPMMPMAWLGEIETEAMPVMPDARTRMAAAPPMPWQGDVAREAMPVVPDARSRVAVESVPTLPEWRGDAALEAMPVVADARTRGREVAIEPPPMPWHGDLAREVMPLQPDPVTRVPRMPVTGIASAAAETAPVCLPEKPLDATSTAEMAPIPVPREPLAFGRALAAVARAQIDGFVIYNARYMTIAYPRGDTQPLYGVCTDVVVRAYRALGIDLQELVHASRLGRGDPSIDHRRVEVIRRFFERHGSSYEISEFADDFLPGDVVTYHRPQGRVSQHHIAIISDSVAPSGRPLIVHNRGWGPQLEDALFVDRITGHYRFAPQDAEAFARSRLPPAPTRHRTADVGATDRR